MESTDDTDTDSVCTIDRSPDRLTIQGSVESMPPNWTKGLLYFAAFVAVAGALSYIFYVIFVVGDPTGFGLDRAGSHHHNPHDDTWGGVLIAGGLIGVVGSAFLSIGVGLLAKKIPGVVRELVYRLDIDPQRVRVEQLFGGEDGDVIRREEMPLDDIAGIRQASQYGGLVSTIELIGESGRTITFGKYIQKDSMEEVTGSDATDDPDEMRAASKEASQQLARIIEEIDSFLQDHRQPPQKESTP